MSSRQKGRLLFWRKLSGRGCSENCFLYEIVKRSLIFIHFHSMTERRLLSENVKMIMWSSHFEPVVPLITVFCYNKMNSFRQVLFFYSVKRSTWVPPYSNYVLIDLYICSIFDKFNTNRKDTERLLKVQYHNFRSCSRVLASLLCRFEYILAAFVWINVEKVSTFHKEQSRRYQWLEKNG